MRLCDNLGTAELHQLLARLRLRDVLKNPIELNVVLEAEERHVGEHCQRVDRRRCGLRGENLLVPHANPRAVR